MQFGKSIGTACTSFAITNIDDMFVLVTFFAEASTSKILTPIKTTIGQYIGFTVIVIISMVGFGASLVLPSEPIGFMGLLPILLGFWNGLDLIFPSEEGDAEISNNAGTMKSILKVCLVTVMNGGDNIGTYIPLFSQTKGAEIAVYCVIYYIMLGIWCLVAFLIMKQKHVLMVAQKYTTVVIPVLYIGLGVYIIVKSSALPWSFRHIDDATHKHIGRTIMAVLTSVLLLACIGVMLLSRLRKKAPQPILDNGVFLQDNPSRTAAPHSSSDDLPV